MQVKPEDVQVAQDGTVSYDYENEDVYGYAADASGQIVPALYDAKNTVISSKITGTKVRDEKVTVKGLVPKTEEQLALSKDTGAFHQYVKDTAGVLEMPAVSALALTFFTIPRVGSTVNSAPFAL